MRLPVGALTGAAGLVLTLVAGCGAAPGDSSGAPPAPGVNGQPGSTATVAPVNVNVAEALKTAEKEFELLTKGDWAAAWKLWTGTAQKSVPEAVFVEVNTACPAKLKQQYLLQNVQPVSEQLVELVFRRGDKVEQGSLRTAGAGWQFEPGATLLVDYASGAKAAIDSRKAANQC